ncbi:hypothetical protein FA13DRAFT_1738272 [Coprinellus micaceus]|uniref:Uncharacterized protein n=1 Tax=Coprinellus micaceus TaxID=71717 RepID=A0A4Y7SUL9_COPMI|nr:hypothetical protein FA13DRAFT_1738272 [Coprinellus micaceus]
MQPYTEVIPYHNPGTTGREFTLALVSDEGLRSVEFQVDANVLGDQNLKVKLEGDSVDPGQHNAESLEEGGRV